MAAMALIKATGLRKLRKEAGAADLGRLVGSVGSVGWSAGCCGVCCVWLGSGLSHHSRYPVFLLSLQLQREGFVQPFLFLEI